MQKPDLVLERALGFERSNKRRLILFICTEFMPTRSKPKYYELLHPDRTLLHRPVAKHYESCLGLACAGEFDGRGNQHGARPPNAQSFQEVSVVRQS